MEFWYKNMALCQPAHQTVWKSVPNSSDDGRSDRNRFSLIGRIFVRDFFKNLFFSFLPTKFLVAEKSFTFSTCISKNFPSFLLISSLHVSCAMMSRSRGISSFVSFLFFPRFLFTSTFCLYSCLDSACGLYRFDRRFRSRASFLELRSQFWKFRRCW